MMPLRMLLCLTLIGASIFSCAAQVIDERVRSRVEQGVAQTIERARADADIDAADVQTFAEYLTDALDAREPRQDALTAIEERPSLGTLALHSMLLSEDTATRAKAARALQILAARAQTPERIPKELAEAVTWLLLLVALDETPEVRQIGTGALSGTVDLGPPAWARARASQETREVCVIVLHHLVRDAEADVRAGARAALFFGGFGPFPPEWDCMLTLGLFARSAASRQPVCAVVAFGYAGLDSVYLCPYEAMVEVTDADGHTTQNSVGPPPERPNPGIQESDEPRFPRGITPLWTYELGDVDAWVVPDILAGHEPLPPGEYQVRARVIVRVYHNEDVEQAFVIREGENPPIWGAAGVWEYEFALTSEPVELTVWGVE